MFFVFLNSQCGTYETASNPEECQIKRRRNQIHNIYTIGDDSVNMKVLYSPGIMNTPPTK